MKVLVTGATGSQAKPVVQQLLKKGYHVVAFTRNAEKAQDLRDQGAEIFEGDLLNREDVRSAIASVDALALHIPFFMADPLQAGENIVEAAKEAKTERIVWNTSGLIFPHETGNPAYDVRPKILQLLTENGLNPITLQPTVYAENLLGPWTAPMVKNENRVAYPVPDNFKIGWLPASDMARAMVAALEKPELMGRTFVISGRETLDGNALKQAFSDGLSRNIEYYAMPPTEFGKIIDTVMGPGAGEAVSAEYQAIWDGHINPVLYADMEETLSILQVEFTNMKDWVSQFSFLFN